MVVQVRENLPAPTPAPFQQGLLQAATVIDDSELRWQLGGEFQPESCEDSKVYDPLCTSESDIPFQFTDGAITTGDATFASATAKFTSVDIGRVISSTAVANRDVTDLVTTKDSTTISSASVAFSSDDVGKGVSSQTTEDVVVTDAVTTNADATVTSATANFTADDVGKTVSGAGIPGGTTILSVTDEGSIEMSANATASASGVSLTIVARKIIQSGAIISSVTNATTAVISLPAQATSTGETLRIANRLVIRSGTTIASVTDGSTVELSNPAQVGDASLDFSIVSRLSPTSVRPLVTELPFAVEQRYACSTWGAQDYEGQGRRALAATEGKAVELEFWSATEVAGNRHLADSDEEKTIRLNSGTEVGIVDALSMLIQAVADYKLGRGMIHARPGLVNKWVSRNLVYRNGSTLRTVAGDVVVVPGAGYPGTSPDGDAPTSTSEWAYATDFVTIFRDTVEVSGLSASELDREKNQRTARAWRNYLVHFNQCAVVGVAVDPSGALDV